ncbi:MAG: hypothetical protein ACREFY_09430, partial [Acetobacteraceae bacterium]
MSGIDPRKRPHEGRRDTAVGTLMAAAGPRAWGSALPIDARAHRQRQSGGADTTRGDRAGGGPARAGHTAAGLTGRPVA